MADSISERRLSKRIRAQIAPKQEECARARKLYAQDFMSLTSLQTLRSHYSMVPVVGPPAGEMIDLEIHARHCDGLIFLLNGTEFLSFRIRHSVESLQEHDSERLWGMARRPPLFFEAEQAGRNRNGRSTRTPQRRSQETCRSGPTPAPATLPGFRRQAETDGESVNAESSHGAAGTESESADSPASRSPGTQNLPSGKGPSGVVSLGDVELQNLLDSSVTPADSLKR